MRPRSIVAALVVVAGAAIWFLPDPAGGPAGVWRAGAVVVVAIGLWATAALPEYFTALIFLLLAVTVGGIAPDLAFSGFHATATWLIFGGLVIGYAVDITGLGARMANTVVPRMAKGYLPILAGIVAMAAAMGLVVPGNSGRVAILVPIVMALADRMGFAPGSNGRTALALAAACGTLYVGFGVLPAAVPNLIMAGAAESIYGIGFTYADYALVHLPVLGLVTLVALPLILFALFPDRPRAAGAATAPAPWDRGQATIAVLLAAALTLWMTDFAHGISPAWVALGVGLLCVMPRVGVAPPSALVGKINLELWFYVAAVVAVGAVVSQSGLGGIVAERLFAWVTFVEGADFLNLAIVSAIGMVMSLLSGVPGQPAIMTTLASEIADATGWPLATAVQAQVLSWTMALFPYQLPPLLLALYMADIPPAALLRVLVAMTVTAWIAILPLTWAWWSLLGMFG